VTADAAGERGTDDAFRAGAGRPARGFRLCARRHDQPLSGGIGGAERVRYGVIVSCRPIEATGAGRDVRGTILGAVGGPAGNEAGQGANEAIFEFILREDNDQALSVVQTNAAGLRPGERVVLSMGSWTRL
jgi:outer membrane lipoprotein SlyB